MFIDYEKKAEEALKEIKRKNLFREYPVISVLADEPPYGILESDQRKILIWGNNNYLGLSNNSEVIKAKVEATKAHGSGSSGTRNILGTSKYLDDLEKKIAQWHCKEKALLHISALDANIGVLSALGKQLPNCIFLSDLANHASIIEGIKSSGANKYIFAHNDLIDLENKLKEIRSVSDSRPIIIVIESVYSMDGSKAPLKEFAELKKKYNALLYVDEVHAIGVMGPTGAGLAEEFGLSDEMDIICGTLGKAVGTSGGYIAGSRNMIEFLRHYSKNFIYTTAMAPDNAAASLKSIEIISSEEGKILRKKQQQAVSDLKNSLKKNGINYLENETHIVPVIIGDEQKTSLIAKDLLEIYNIAVTPIFFPTVNVGGARLRINPTPNHTKKMADEFADALKFLLEKYKDLGPVKNIANDDESCDKKFIKQRNGS